MGMYIYVSEEGRITKRKVDKQLVARTQEHEIDYIAGKYGIPKVYVYEAIREAGKDGKPSRSRKMIYYKLREIGYVINTK